MNRLEQMYKRIEKRGKGNDKELKFQKKTWEKIALQFQACADLSLMKARQFKKN